MRTRCTGLRSVRAILDGILHSSNPDGDEEITFTHTEALCDKECHYTVGVLGRRELSVFWVIATLEQGHIPLSALAPFVTKAPRASTTYFKHIITSRRVTKVEFLLVPIIGNPDLYVSRLTLYPNSTSEYRSTNPGNLEELITIEKPSEGSLEGDYYVAVASNAPASFSLSVTQTFPGVLEKLELTPGVTILYLMENMQQIWLILDVSPNAANPRNLRLSVVPFVGKVTVCVALNHTDPSACVYSYQCTHFQPFDCIQELPILTSNLPLSTQYWALITLFTPDDHSSVALLYSSGQHIRLSPNHNYRDIIEPNAYYHYSYTAFPPYTGLTLHEGIVSGDIDLYLSFSEKDKYPTNETAQYKAETGFEDRLIVSKEDMDKQCSTEFCVAYISVRAAVRSAFTLHLTQRVRDVIYTISDGGKANYHAEKGEKCTIELLVITHDPAFITVTSYEGTPFISGKLVTAACYEHTEACPGVALNASKLDYGYQVSVSSLQIADLCISMQCRLWAIAECESPLCRLQAAGLQSAYPAITPNIPLYDSVLPDSINYYLLYTARNFTELTVDLALISSALDADLYMNRGTEVRDVRKFQWKSTQIGCDSIHISAEEYFSTIHWGYFLIAVKGVDEAKYSLRVTVESTTMIPLGFTSLQLRIKPLSSVLCYFPHQYNEEIRVEGVVKYGSVQLYMKSYPNVVNITVFYPSESDYYWQSSLFGSFHDIAVIPEDLNFCYHCFYVLRVSNTGHNGAEISLCQTSIFAPSSVSLDLPVFFSGKQDSMIRMDTDTLMGNCEFYALPLKGKITFLASRYATVSMTNYDYIGRDIGGIQYFTAENSLNSSYQLVLGAYLHSDSVVIIGIIRPTDMRYIEEVDDMLFGTLYLQGTERGFYTRGNCTCQITAVSGDFNFTVADYIVTNDYKTLVQEYTTTDPLLNRITITNDQNTHLILIITQKNEQVDPQQEALLRLSIYRYPFEQGFGLNSEQFGEIKSGNGGKEYRLNGGNLDVEVEIGLETFGIEGELVIISTLQGGNKREEVAIETANNIHKSRFLLQNVSFVSVKIASKEGFDGENSGEFMLYSRVINEDIELFPGDGGQIQVSHRDSDSRISWEPLAATSQLKSAQISYQLYASAREFTLKSLCSLHSGLIHGNVTYLHSQNHTTAIVPAGLWVTVLAVELGQRSTTLRTYIPYSPVYVPSKDRDYFPVAVIVGICAVAIISFLLLFLYYRKRRISRISSLQSSELASLTS